MTRRQREDIMMILRSLCGIRPEIFRLVGQMHPEVAGRILRMRIPENVRQQLNDGYWDYVQSH